MDAAAGLDANNDFASDAQNWGNSYNHAGSASALLFRHVHLANRMYNSCYH